MAQVNDSTRCRAACDRHSKPFVFLVLDGADPTNRMKRTTRMERLVEYLASNKSGVQEADSPAFAAFSRCRVARRAQTCSSAESGPSGGWKMLEVPSLLWVLVMFCLHVSRHWLFSVVFRTSSLRNSLSR